MTNGASAQAVFTGTFGLDPIEWRTAEGVGDLPVFRERIHS
jgi:hypothetical protein